MAEKSLEAHLYEALKNGNTKRALYIVKLLGDKINKLYRGKTPLVWAKEFENDDVINALSEKGAVEEVISDEEAERLGLELIEASRSGRMDEIERLIEVGADINLKDNDGDIALIWASRNGHLEVVEKLIEKGADVNQKNDYGKTALMRASYYGHLEIVEKLLDVGVDINVQDDYGWTALITASHVGHLEIVEKLFDAGADLDVRDSGGYTALMRAIGHERVETATMLIEAGADLNLKDNDGANVLGYLSNKAKRKAILDAIKLRKEKEKENEPDVMGKIKGFFSKG